MKTCQGKPAVSLRYRDGENGRPTKAWVISTSASSLLQTALAALMAAWFRNHVQVYVI